MEDSDNNKSKTEQLIVSGYDNGQRLDRFLQKNFPQASYVLVQKLIRKGQVRINGKRADTSERLEEGDQIRIPPIFKNDSEKTDSWFRPEKHDDSLVKKMVIYDDGDIVAINKPSGIASQGGMKIARHMDALVVHLADSEGNKPKLIHRLDRDTSGILLFARNRDTISALGKVFSSRIVQKTYLAITVPAPEIDEGLIDMPLAKGEGAMKDMIIIDKKNGKKAITEFKVIEKTGKTAALVEFYPKTGRTHQIRVHAMEAGFPLLGDPKYKLTDLIEHHDEHKGENAFEFHARLHLHALRLTLPDPRKNQNTDKQSELNFFAPIPDDFKTAMESLGFEGG